MKRKGKIYIPYKPLITIALVIVLLVAFSYAINRVSSGNESQQTDILDRALNKSITECYALEGSYPPDIKYLTEHYGLTYDKDDYRIDYTFIGSNIRPDYTIVVIGE